MKLALYQPDIAQNLGTSLRTAACLGIDVEIIEPCGFPLDDRKLKRSGMDYIDYVKYTRHKSWEHFKEWTEENNSRIVLLSSKASISYTKFNFLPNDVLMVGRESAGVPPEVVEYCTNAVTIPMKNGMRSLNVAISAAIVLGEALRQINT
ncbi:MAG: ((34)-2-O)-methyltransferase [Rickettsiaceae bacterium]|jgi:tRNA (cytidine/uridine-2'-O-)-methyltransferase|nr:((34)-2-O)-methyltransferase [Rickettsiaceae bacterium]